MSERNPDSGQQTKQDERFKAIYDRILPEVEAACEAARDARWNSSWWTRTFRKKLVRRRAFAAYMARMAQADPRRARG